ncbi:transcription initiation factor TFIID subunit 4-like isoform X2 [Equus przewalskii]|uniref:Transcription initiation factor TFIID subunit 4-like isoform X2 n=1 Tax=Equus przewalskii TaxID=9798 RepID=A0ABM4MK48_EQUPR
MARWAHAVRSRQPGACAAAPRRKRHPGPVRGPAAAELGTPRALGTRPDPTPRPPRRDAPPGLALTQRPGGPSPRPSPPVQELSLPSGPQERQDPAGVVAQVALAAAGLPEKEPPRDRPGRPRAAGLGRRARGSGPGASGAPAPLPFPEPAFPARRLRQASGGWGLFSPGAWVGRVKTGKLAAHTVLCRPRPLQRRPRDAAAEINTDPGRCLRRGADAPPSRRRASAQTPGEASNVLQGLPESGAPGAGTQLPGLPKCTEGRDFFPWRASPRGSWKTHPRPWPRGRAPDCTAGCPPLSWFSLCEPIANEAGRSKQSWCGQGSRRGPAERPPGGGVLQRKGAPC